MTQTSIEITSLLDCLLVLLPPKAITLIGAGDGSGPLVDWITRSGSSPVTLIEADGPASTRLERTAGSQPGWRVLNQVISIESHEVTFYSADLASESGLIRPEELRGLWPNLRTREENAARACALSEVLAGHPGDGNWVFVDCLPAAKLLASLGERLTGIDVALLRVQLGDVSTSDSCIEEIERTFAEHGLRLVGTQAGRHPGLGHAILVREFKESASRREIEVSALRSQVESTSRELLAQVEAKQSKLTAAQKELEVIKAIAEEADKKVAHQADAIEQLNDRIAALAAEVQQRQEEVRELASAKAAAEHALISTRRKDSELEQASAIWVSQGNELRVNIQAAVGVMERLVADQHSERVSTSSALKVVAESVRSLNDKFLELAPPAPATPAADYNAQHKNELDALRSELVSTREALTQQSATVQLALSTAREEVGEIKTIAKATTSRIDEQTSALSDLSAQVAGFSSDFTKQLDQAQQVIAEGNAALHALDLVRQEKNDQERRTIERWLEQGDALGQKIEATLGKLEQVSEHQKSGSLEGRRGISEVVSAINAVNKKLGEFEALGPTLLNIDQRQAENKQQLLTALKETESRQRDLMNKGLTNTVMQIEAFINIQSQLAGGERLPSLHGWPISADIALYMLERIREKKYDLIIEFGSGTSTVLFAKAVSDYTDRGVKRVVSFEHDVVYLEETRRLLRTHGKEDYVDLIHAPLVSWTDQQTDFLYYDCESTIRRIAHTLSDQVASILVLVDGPPSATGPNARYPAVPHIFTHLARHRIDLVLDDASRSDEKASIELWRQYFQKRSIRLTERNVPTEKGVFIAMNYGT